MVSLKALVAITAKVMDQESIVMPRLNLARNSNLTEPMASMRLPKSPRDLAESTFMTLIEEAKYLTTQDLVIETRLA